MSADQLLPAIVQDARTGRVLMLAWMNDEALRLTRETGEVHFYSRSRKALWKKGETSGNVLRLVEIKADCDGDAWLVRAVPAGPTCHTGSLSCWGTDGVEPDPDELHVLERTIQARKAAPPGTRSYVRSLLDHEDPSRVGQKVIEEAGELAVELARPDAPKERIVAEAADLFFHALIGLGQKDVSLDDVLGELHRRAGVSGLDEKASRPKK